MAAGIIGTDRPAVHPSEAPMLRGPWKCSLLPRSAEHPLLAKVGSSRVSPLVVDSSMLAIDTVVTQGGSSKRSGPHRRARSAPGRNRMDFIDELRTLAARI